jgi:fructose/tagatose bisphosphate aldolase
VRFPVFMRLVVSYSRRDIKSPIILQVSQGGSAYFAGKGLANDKQQASIIGAITAAQHVRLVSRAYGVYVREIFPNPLILNHLPL